jgi:hypothetical protein
MMKICTTFFLLYSFWLFALDSGLIRGSFVGFKGGLLQVEEKGLKQGALA